MRAVPFFALACVISWALWAPLWLPAFGVAGLPVWRYQHASGAFGPLVAAFALTAMRGRREFLILLTQMIAWRGRLRWLTLALLGPAGILVAALAAEWAMGGVPSNAAAALTSREFPEWSAAGFLVYNILTFGYGEETGWRGYALPTLHRTHSAIAATLVVTAGWAVWHAPLFLYRPGYVAMSPLDIMGWLASLTTGSILLTWLYCKSRRSVLAAALFHASVDVVFTSGASSPLTTTVAGGLLTVWGLAILPSIMRRRPHTG